MLLHRAFGKNLRRERDLRGLTMSELARLSGTHASEISRLEKGQRDPRLSTVHRLARGLGVTPAYLLLPPQGYEARWTCSGRQPSR